MKRPDFITQVFYNETPWFWICFKNRQIVFSGVKSLLLTAGVKLSLKLLDYLTGHLSGAPTFLT
jgi:hypothetical protein